MLGAVIFDLDGVLVDSEPWWGDARSAVADRHGGDWTPEDEARIKGANSREWSAAMRDRLGLRLARKTIEREVVDAMVARYERDRPVAIAPGIAAVARLRGRYPLAVASSAHPRVIGAALRALGLADAFEVVVSADEVGAGKPAPDVYLEAARQLRLPAGDCLVVEDSPNGVRAAHSAGMRVAWVGRATRDRDGDAPGATVVLDSLDAFDEAMLEGIAADG
jgi:HAD superfamily hydrolase (TIGR01509 family)